MANYKTDERPLKSGVYVSFRMILLNSFKVKIKKENVSGPMDLPLTHRGFPSKLTIANA